MHQPSTDMYFAEILTSAAQLADVVSTHDPELPVPTCPDWNLRQLGTHVGRVHRWAAEIVGTGAAERIPFESVPDGAYPAAPAERAAWLNAGAARVIAAVTAAGDELVWAFGRQVPASFWARRQAHETMVHRADAELAVGREVVLDAMMAADGIDEWLAMATGPGRRGDGSAALPVGAALRLQATGPGETDDWVIGSTPDGLSLQRGSLGPGSTEDRHALGEAGVSVSGPADRLLLVLVRQRPADDPAITVTGDRALLAGWLRRHTVLIMADLIMTGEPAGGPVATAAATCDRIEAVDADLHAFMAEPGRRARLNAAARELVTRWPTASARPALYGIPVGIKDVFRVDGLPTTAGSELPPHLLAGEEAEAVRRLRAAGTLIAGKTVTAEFAMFVPGPTGNPRAPGHTPGGSSSGSAAAVAAGLVPLALGTQTIASVIRPAAYCGVAGFRPTRGRIPADGVIPFAPSLDVVGCFAAEAAGLARAAAVLCDEWRLHAGPSRPVLGIPAGPYLQRAGRPALAAFTRHVAALSAAGYVVREVPALADMDDVERLLIVISRYEAAQVHHRRFARYGELYRPGTAALIRQGQAIEASDYTRALAGAEVLSRRLAAVAADAGIDAWLTPAATGPAPSGLDSTGDPVMSVPWSLAGLPAVALPAGLAGGLPVGVQVVAAAGADERLLHWATVLAPALARTALTGRRSPA